MPFYVFIGVIICVVASCLFILIFTKEKSKIAELKDKLFSFLVGILFSSGLIVAGLLKRSKYVRAITFDKNWEPSLIFFLFAFIVVKGILLKITKKYE